MKLITGKAKGLWTVEYLQDTEGYPWHVDTLDRYVKRHLNFVMEGRKDKYLLLAIVDTREEASVACNELSRRLTPGLAALQERGVSYMDAAINQMELNELL